MKRTIFWNSVIALILTGFVIAAEYESIRVTVSHAKLQPGETVEITVVTQRKETLHGLLLKPTIGAEDLSFQKMQAGVYRGVFEVKENTPDGLYVVHVWTGNRENPSAVGKASFRIGNIVADFFVANYLDQQKPAEDLDNYLKDFRAVGGNFLIAHNLIISSGAFYRSKIAKTSATDGSENDFVELLLHRADKEGFSVLLSVSWDRTRNSPYKERMKEIKSIISEMYSLYRHHPSLAGFYSWQEGSGTYYASFMREFAEYVKNVDAGLLTACAPHIDDPLLASYLSVIEELDIMIYQGAVMASYRTDNRKKYPLRRVRDFCALGAGAKRLQDKITLTHVELFSYMEKRQSEDFVTASDQDILGQILSAATVTDTDGISFFTYHAHIYSPLKKFSQVEKSREAVVKGVKAYQLITAEVSQKRNPLALYIPYSDWLIERWSNYFLPALDALRSLGAPFDILPFAPRLDESVYPYYPIHHNEDVLERLLKEKTVLVLANVSGFQQTDSDLIKAFVDRGGVIVSFGPQIPMGRSYERREIFGGREAGMEWHHQIFVKNSIGNRVAPKDEIKLHLKMLPAWESTGATVIACYEDSTAAILVNTYGKGHVFTILPDAATAARNFPDLTRDVLEAALQASGHKTVAEITGLNENTDLAMAKTESGFCAAIINHNADELIITVTPLLPVNAVSFYWFDLASGKKFDSQSRNLILTIPPHSYRCIGFNRQPVD